MCLGVYSIIKNVLINITKFFICILKTLKFLLKVIFFYEIKLTKTINDIFLMI